MCSWYGDAAFCYPYLASATEPVEELRKYEYDFFDAARTGARERSLKEWFRRGWTLQELLVAREMEFFDAEWVHIGSRSEVQNQIQKAANTALEYLSDFHIASVAIKLSWTAQRETQKEKDCVYLLLGLPGVSLDIH